MSKPYDCDSNGNPWSWENDELEESANFEFDENCNLLDESGDLL